MTNISWEYMVLVLIFFFMLFMIAKGTADYNKRTMYDGVINTIRIDIANIAPRILAQIGKKSTIDPELKEAIRKLENAAEKLEKAAEMIERNSNRLSNATSILSMLKTIEKL